MASSFLLAGVQETCGYDSQLWVYTSSFSYLKGKSIKTF